MRSVQTGSERFEYTAIFCYSVGNRKFPGENEMVVRKRMNRFLLIFLVCLSAVCSLYSQGDYENGDIYLYGETHGVVRILEKEIDIYSGYYQEDHMRHLFIEYPYFISYYLNEWIQSPSDEILDSLYEQWKGSASYNPAVKEFFEEIKKHCPQTVFHGIDVGHFYWSIGEQLREDLEENGMSETEEYSKVIKSIEQGEVYYETGDSLFREQMMVENFIEEFESLEGESVMGIFGSMHVTNKDPEEKNRYGNLATGLIQTYGDRVHTESLTSLAANLLEDPMRVDTITIDGIEYEASFFGRQYLKNILPRFIYRDFYRIENAYDDFSNKKKNSNVLPYNNYPVQVQTKDVFMIEFCLADGSLERQFYRSDGNTWNDMPVTEQFLL